MVAWPFWPTPLASLPWQLEQVCAKSWRPAAMYDAGGLAYVMEWLP